MKRILLSARVNYMSWCDDTCVMCYDFFIEGNKVVANNKVT